MFNTRLKKTLFLKWCVINLIATTIAAVALVMAQPQIPGISIMAKVMVGAILLVYLVANGIGGKLCWQADMLERKLMLVHGAENLNYAADVCPYIGLLGAVTGILVFMSAGVGSATDADHIQQVVATSMTGIGIAFIPTIAGIFARIILSWQYHMIVNQLNHPA